LLRLQIDFDEDTKRILTELTGEYQRDLGKAVSDLVQAHASLESLAERC
jgi:hypothetical protein